MNRTSETTSQRRAKYGKEMYIAAGSLGLILLSLIMRFGSPSPGRLPDLALWLVLILGGGPLVWDLILKVRNLEFGSDLLAGLAILTAALLGQLLAGSIVVVMLAGGGALEAFAIGRASDTLRVLAQRMPTFAHRKEGESISDAAVEDVAVGDTLVVYPHEICPTDGVVIAGHGVMNEAFLTGEPFEIAKAPGSETISGALNGSAALTIRVSRRAVDSRYAKIMLVMEEAEKSPPRIRRIGDRLGALYTPLAVALAACAWLASGESERFLAVLVVATPCPLLIAIPVAVIGAISYSARRGILVKNPAALEQLKTARAIVFDKTGTLTYGKPLLSRLDVAPGLREAEVLGLAAALETYSKHPLSSAIVQKARELNLTLPRVESIDETPGQGLSGVVEGRRAEITGRGNLARRNHAALAELPAQCEGAECVLLVDDRFAARMTFRDMPRDESRSFVAHLQPLHGFTSVLLLSGDRESEVEYLARHVGIHEIHANKSPEEKLAIVRELTQRMTSVFIGDGINDAPSLAAATIGIAFGPNSDITSEAADAVILEPSIRKVDELFHIAARMRRILLQSAVGGMGASVLGMLVAATGHLAPVPGALTQELIDLVAVLNALRSAFSMEKLSDFDQVRLGADRGPSERANG